ncbi:MAG: hypothetical protein LC713_07815, partial [Actinobacteria bacterium]|nr:hypothetical protein [Actinomycetota bacterium]
RGVVGWILLVALVTQTVVGLHFFRLQRDYYGVVTPQTLSALTWVKAHTPSTSTIAVTMARDDLMLGWWVESVGRRRTIYAAPSYWLNFEDERVRARKAAELFNPDFPDAHTIELAQHDGVQYVFVDKAWSGFRPTTMAEFSSLHPGVVVFENASVVILGVPLSRPAAP